MGKGTGEGPSSEGGLRGEVGHREKAIKAASEQGAGSHPEKHRQGANEGDQTSANDQRHADRRAGSYAAKQGENSGESPGQSVQDGFPLSDDNQPAQGVLQEEKRAQS